VEFDDIIKLLKFWRVFKNLKNFKSGGLRVKFKSIVAVFAIGLSGVSYLFSGDIRIDVRYASKLYSEMVEKLHEIDDVCDNEASYEEAAIVQIASLRPLGHEVQFASQAIETSQDGDMIEIQLRGARAPIRTTSK